MLGELTTNHTLLLHFLKLCFKARKKLMNEIEAKKSISWLDILLADIKCCLMRYR